MKKLITIMMCCVSFACLAQDKNTVKENVSDAVSGVISIGKDTLSGVQKGIEDGRKDGESLDGAIIIGNQKELKQYNVSLSVSKINKITGSIYEIVMVVRNNESQPVRLINLSKAHQVILLDDEGFASNLKSIVSDAHITVPAKAAIRSTWRFTDVNGKPDVLRIYEEDIKLTDSQVP